MTTGYHCAIFPFCGGGKKKGKKTKAFYDWATTGTPVKNDLAVGFRFSTCFQNILNSGARRALPLNYTK